MKKEPQKKIRDPFLRLKYLGYCLSQMPEKDATLEEFIQYAKFQLCVKNRVLMQDPVWDTYTKEHILTEFYAHQIMHDKEFRERLEKDLDMEGTAIDDFAAWADAEIDKNKEELGEVMGHGIEDKVSFKPLDVIGDE